MSQSIFQHRLSKRLLFDLETNSMIQSLLSQIDTHKGEIVGSSKLSGQFLKRLNQTIIASSTGASTRIEGSNLSDKDVERLIREGKLRKIATRDEQEVVGYFEILENVFDEYDSVSFDEKTIKQIHSILLKYSQKDTKHRGQYKSQSNQVVAMDVDNNIVGVIFEPASVDSTPSMMIDAIQWASLLLESKQIHPLLVIANFVFEFLSIHPFKDGNGRVSRVITNLLLLQSGYEFTKLVSHEKLIEEDKAQYYINLRKSSQKWNTLEEDVSDWIIFFLEIILKQSNEAKDLLECGEDIQLFLSNKQLAVYNALVEDEELSSSDLHKITGISQSTVKQALNKLMGMNKVRSFGQGRATRYSAVME